MEKAKKKVYNNVGRANIFQNRWKKGDKEPDLKGDGEIMGNKIGIAGWFKEDKNGRRFLSLSFDDIIEGETPPHRRKESKDLDGWFDEDPSKNGNKKPPWDQ